MKINTVEPFLLCYVVASIMSSQAIVTMNMEKACRVDLNQTKEKCDEKNGTLTMQIQSKLDEINMWTVPLQTCVPMIFLLLAGAWSDRTGNRKAILLLPIFGDFVATCGIFLTYFFEKWSVYVNLLVGALSTIFCGGLSVALVGSASFLADVTSLEARTFRFGMVGIVVTRIIPASISISKVLLESVGYYGIFGASIVLHFFGILYVFFGMHDIKPIKMESTLCEKLIDFFHPKNAWDTVRIIVKSDVRMKVILVAAAHFINLGADFGEDEVYLEYLEFRFDMTEEEKTKYFTYAIVVATCGAAATVTVFSKWLKMHDAIIVMMTTASRVLSGILFGLAPTKAWYYSGPAVDLIGNAGTTTIRSMATKVVEPEQIGKTCALLALAEFVVPLVYPPMFRRVYNRTLDTTLPGAFYLVASVMRTPLFFILIYLYIVHRREQRDVPKNPDEKETYAHDNDVTSF